MAQEIPIGVAFALFTFVFCLIGGWYYKFKLWTVFVSVSLISLSFFYIPHANYSWLEYGLDNAFAWSIFFIVKGGEFVHSKFTTYS